MIHSYNHWRTQHLIATIGYNGTFGFGPNTRDKVIFSLIFITINKLFHNGYSIFFFFLELICVIADIRSIYIYGQWMVYDKMQFYLYLDPSIWNFTWNIHWQCKWIPHLNINYICRFTYDSFRRYDSRKQLERMRQRIYNIEV